jgi:hypothetical protein
MEKPASVAYKIAAKNAAIAPNLGEAKLSEK